MFITFIFKKVTETWMKEFGYWLDIMAVSCDSFDEEINKKIGRYVFVRTIFHKMVNRLFSKFFIIRITITSFYTFDRHAKGRNHLENLRRVRQLCKEYGVLFKINTVVNRHNVNDDMSKEIKELAPIRWKVFQCLSIYAENEGPGALKKVSDYSNMV